MSYVFVVDQTRRPLAPVHPGLARLLLTSGRAAVLRRFPFTVILKTAAPAGALAQRSSGSTRAPRPRDWPWSTTRPGKWCGQGSWPIEARR